MDQVLANRGQLSTIRKAARGFRIADDILDKLLTIVFILLFLMGAYVAYDAAFVYTNTVSKNISVYRPSFDPENSDEGYTLADLSDDAMGWLYIDDTSIDFPIMQSDDNAFYLNHDPLGHFMLSGSIFIDFQCSGDFSDPFTVVHGHHMEGGAMFGVLQEYLDGNYFDAHRTGNIVTRDGRLLKLEIFAVGIVSGYDDMIYDPQYAGEVMREYIPYIAMFYHEPFSYDHVLCLSTCKTPRSTDRIVVFCAVSE